MDRENVRQCEQEGSEASIRQLVAMILEHDLAEAHAAQAIGRIAVVHPALQDELYRTMATALPRSRVLESIAQALSEMGEPPSDCVGILIDGLPGAGLKAKTLIAKILKNHGAPGGLLALWYEIQGTSSACGERIRDQERHKPGKKYRSAFGLPKR